MAVEEDPGLMEASSLEAPMAAAVGAPRWPGSRVIWKASRMKVEEGTGPSGKEAHRAPLAGPSGSLGDEGGRRSGLMEGDLPRGSNGSRGQGMKKPLGQNKHLNLARGDLNKEL